MLVSDTKSIHIQEYITATTYYSIMRNEYKKIYHTTSNVPLHLET